MILPAELVGQSELAEGVLPGDSIARTSLPRAERQASLVPTSFRLQPYGSNANFNPLSMLVNRGLDMWQLEEYSPRITRFPYARSAGSVWRAMTHPSEVIERYGGSSKFWTTQILPLSFPGLSKDRRPAWAPNYTLHFFMGGVTYVRTEGWFAERGWPTPKLLSGVTVMAAAYLTEMTEAGYGDAGAATFADLAFFDFGGILAFNIPWVRNFIGEKTEVLDWSLQPVFTRYGEVYNQGDYLALRVPLPFSDRVKFLWRMGVGGWSGLSFARGRADAVTVAVGFETLSQEIDQDTLDESITVGFAGGVFYDRNGSLLGALEWGLRERFVSLNIYPGVLPGPLADMGLWLSVDRDIRPRFGLVARALGFGFGHSPSGPSRIGLGN